MLTTGPSPSLLQLLCSAVQKALFEEEEKVWTLSQKVRSLEKANDHLREKVKSMKRLLRQAQRETPKDKLYGPKAPRTHPDQDTGPRLKKTSASRTLKN